MMLMNTDRCAMSDPIILKQGAKSRKSRFVSQGSEWRHVNDFLFHYIIWVVLLQLITT